MKKTNNKIKILLTAVMLFLVCACSPDTDYPVLEPYPKDPGGTYLGEKIDNPYSLDNMKKALSSLQQAGQLSGNVSIAPTHLYIKLTPQDSTELNRILEDTTLNLFPYPLDYKLEGEGPYVAPVGTEADLYTVIPIDHDMNGIPYVLIEECFIPEDEDHELAKLELESMKLTGNITESEILQLEMEETKGLWKKPRGRVAVYNTKSEELQGVSGVKVLVSWCVKIASTYTDEYGNYRINRGYLFDVHYFAIFRNQEGFSLYSNWGFLLPAIHHVGRHNRRGYDIHIGTGSQAWPWATINNAAHVFYNDMCSSFQINKPHSDLRIWYWDARNDESTGAAPMLQHVVYDTTSLSGLLLALGISQPFLITGLPDLFLFQQRERATENYYRTVFHELSHAAHFKQVGSLYWATYIYQICQNSLGGSLYGTEPNGNNEIIGVGEMWGYYFDYKCLKSHFNIDELRRQTDWFKPQILKEIEEETGLTPAEIFMAFTSDVCKHEELRENLKELYGHDDIIDACFARHGF